MEYCQIPVVIKDDIRVLRGNRICSLEFRVQVVDKDKRTQTDWSREYLYYGPKDNGSERVPFADISIDSRRPA